ncbi:MAG: cytochrome c [Acidobacteriota bacterium]
MKAPLGLVGTVLAVLLMLSACGEAGPPAASRPAASGADDGASELVARGKEIFAGKGICLTCHNGSARYPDVTTMAANAGTRVEGLDDVEYLVQSLYQPDAFITPGFSPGMPIATQPPMSLSPEEVTAVIAYLQSFGGSPTVTLERVLAAVPDDQS